MCFFVRIPHPFFKSQESNYFLPKMTKLLSTFNFKPKKNGDTSQRKITIEKKIRKHKPYKAHKIDMVQPKIHVHGLKMVKNFQNWTTR